MQAKGLKAVFECVRSGAVLPGVQAYGWALNGVSVDPGNLSSGVSLGPGSLSLKIQATLQNNNTIVQCIAFGENKRLPSENATMVVQGQLPHYIPILYRRVIFKLIVSLHRNSD